MSSLSSPRWQQSRQGTIHKFTFLLLQSPPQSNRSINAFWEASHKNAAANSRWATNCLAIKPSHPELHTPIAFCSSIIILATNRSAFLWPPMMMMMTTIIIIVITHSQTTIDRLKRLWNTHYVSFAGDISLSRPPHSTLLPFVLIDRPIWGTLIVLSWCTRVDCSPIYYITHTTTINYKQGATIHHRSFFSVIIGRSCCCYFAEEQQHLTHTHTCLRLGGAAPNNDCNLLRGGRQS